MPLPISDFAKEENNKVASTNVTLVLLKIEYPTDPVVPIRICFNNELVIWPSTSGDSYLPAIFSLSGLGESKDADIPGITLQFTDFSRTLIPLVDAFDGGVGASLTMYVVNSNNLAETTPELQHEFSIIDATITENYNITFKLGAENLLKRKCPINRYLKNRCRFTFDDTNCNYTGGTATTCALTYSECATNNNTHHFGGFPNLGRSGFMD